MTIWEMLAEAVESMPERFGRKDVLRWFATHHPDVSPASIGPHLQGATSNASPESRGTFAHRTPLVTRVGRGEYVHYRGEGSQSAPSDRTAREETAPSDRPIREKLDPPASTSTVPSTQGTYDIALVSCGKAKRSTPSAAAELYTSDGFRKRRLIAEDAARAWFILSAEHGLVPPDEVLAPYDLALAETGPDYRAAWGAWVVAKLIHKVGPLHGKSVLVLAPAAYADAIRPHLQQAGARLKEPLAGLRQGEQGAWLAAEVGRRHLSSGTAAMAVAPVTVAAVDDHVREARDAAIAAALVTYREQREAARITTRVRRYGRGR